MLHQVLSPPSLQLGFPLLSSPLLSLVFIASIVTSYSPFHFFFVCTPPLPPAPPSAPLSLTTPSCPVMDIGSVIS